MVFHAQLDQKRRLYYKKSLNIEYLYLAVQW